MQGIIVNFDSEKNLGIIRGEDGLRYQFTSDEWRETKIYPKKGMSIDFEVIDKQAKEIYVIEDNKKMQVSKRHFKIDIKYLVGIIALVFFGVIWFRIEYEFLKSQEQARKLYEDAGITPPSDENFMIENQEQTEKTSNDINTTPINENPTLNPDEVLAKVNVSMILDSLKIQHANYDFFPKSFDELNSITDIEVLLNKKNYEFSLVALNSNSVIVIAQPNRQELRIFTGAISYNPDMQTVNLIECVADKVETDPELPTIEKDEWKCGANSTRLEN